MNLRASAPEVGGGSGENAPQRLKPAEFWVLESQLWSAAPPKGLLHYL